MQAAHFKSFDKLELFRQPTPKEFGRPSTAPKKARNPKNLAVDTSGAFAYGRPAATATLPLQPFAREPGMMSAPMSPTFVKPLKPPRRKASALGLSIVTPASDSPPAPEDPAPVPQTPSLTRPNVLRHFPSSPSLPMRSPGVPPEGGMQLPPLATRRSISVGFAEAPSEQDEDDHMNGLNDPEIQPPAYPDGPICIYDPHVYLSNEPSAEQASDFDVILNVASEVLNPFMRRKSSTLDGEKSLTADDDAAANNNDADTSSFFQTAPSSPTEPSASPKTTAPPLLTHPDYIHVPWEHNTDIVPDLYDLVKVIDEKVQQGKKVLIHCQCGVSRSASLIVAYGLYKNPTINVQEAYDAVKRRSKWIGPNMSLIMQLQEFRTELLKRSAGMPAKHGRPRSKTKIPLSQASTGDKVISSDSTTDASAADGPHSAPLLPEVQRPEMASTKKKLDSLTTSGPSSAPSGYAWPKTPCDEVSKGSESMTKEAAAPPAPLEGVKPISAETHGQQFPSAEVPREMTLHHRPAQLALPFSHLSRFKAANTSALPAESPRAAEFAMAPAQPPPLDDSFGLTSPRASAFNDLNSSTSANVPPLAPQQVVLNPPASSAVSPRSKEFAMTSIRSPPAEDDLGLMSPRNNGFSMQLPQRFTPASSKAAAFSALYPPQHNNSSHSHSAARDRASLRSKLGMSTRSSYDMRSEYVLAAEAKELTPVQPPEANHETAQDIGASEALTSPRAFEFTKNPFHKPPKPAAAEAREAMFSPTSGTFGEQVTSGGPGAATAPTPAPQEEDPRSPAHTGASPIIRNIFEVF